MKKAIIAGVLSALVSGSAFADIASGLVDGSTDTTSAAITWEASVPTTMPGKWVTFRGEGGSELKPSTMDIKADGSFTATPIKLELWYFDEATNAPIEIVSAGAAPGTTLGGTVPGTGASGVKYSVDSVTFTAGSSDVSTAEAEVTLDGTAMVAGGAPTASSNYTTEWNITPKTNINKVVPGDTIQAQTIVTAEVAFADLP
ncbi:hypothetical protein WAX88_18040 [Photobacterium damselae subsp. damselae]|uniref:hypothetical protein n=1 Tax=Photobacterium damselae TaxID=38293 RepID=UPI00311B4250